MKILYTLEDGRLGGMAKMILEIASRVLSNEIQSKIIIAHKNSEELSQIARKLNLDVSLIDIKFLSKKPKLILSYLVSFIPDLLKAIKEIKRFNPEIVYCNGSQHVKFVIAAKLLGKKVIWQMHDTYQPKPIVHLFHFVSKLFRVDYFAASSQRTIAFYNLPQNRTLLSIPPVDTSAFNSFDIKSSTTGKVNIISVSNVNPDKGLDVLIRTAAKVNEKRNDINFNIIGLIPDTQKELYHELLLLKDRLNVQNVNFLGQRNDIRSLLAEADVYLCCSNNESGPMSVFEAMSMKIPVVSTDVGDLRRIFSINHSSKVVPTGDHNALANQILLMLENPEEMKRLGERGRLTALQHLDINISVKIHQKFYRKILSTP